MAGYTKVVAEGSGEYNITKENFAKINDAVFDLKHTILNVKDYGAIGNGVADDTAAIQACINDCAIISVIGGNGHCGVVGFPPGKYVCSGLVMPNDQTFTGSGTGTSGVAYGNYITLKGLGGFWGGGAWLIRKAATDNVMVDASGTMGVGGSGVINRSVGLRIVDLAIHGNGGTKPLLRAYYVSDIAVDRVRFDSNLGPAIEGVEFQDSRFNNCWINNCCGAVESDRAGTVGKESLRLLGRGDGSPASTVFGYTTDNNNNIWFVGCLWTNANSNPNAGTMAMVTNGTGYPGTHRVYFMHNKIEAGNMKGSQIKLLGGSSRIQWISFEDSDFTGYNLGTGAAAITWIEADTAYSCTVRKALFDDGPTAGVTHAPFKLTDAEFWTIEDISTNLGTVGGEANPAALIHCGFSNGQPIVIGNVRHLSRNSPWFSGSTITDRRMPPKSGLFSSTPGAVTTVNIAHGLGYTPSLVSVDPASVNSRGAPSRHITVDGTNIILNFSAALTASTVYDWRWIVS